MEANPVQPEKTSRPKLLIVDGHAYAYRAFHAIRELHGPAGQPTNAIYGFIKMLGKMQTLIQPTHWMVIWDGGLCAERLSALPEYKVHRPPMPPGLEQQIEEIFSYLKAAHIASYCEDGVEADDCIATVVRQAVSSSGDVVIASSDKDFMQLVSPQVGLFNPNDKSDKIWTAADVRAKTGVEPSQIIDWLSIIGDSVDNIAGVPGVGPKTAEELLAQFGSVESLYGRLGEVRSERLRKNLEAAASAVRRNQRLIRLNANIPCALCLEDITVKRGEPEQLKALYARWGFKTLLAGVSEAPSQQENLL